ncbi:MAG: hypothetical protein ACU0CO_02250 [Shimia sp.]
MATPTHSFTEVELPDLLAAGGTVVVTCEDAPHRRTSGIHRSWTVTVTMPDGTVRQLVTTRDRDTVRSIKTIGGITSFIASLGIEPVTVPMKKGRKSKNRPGPV